jgi:hypothetical protein
MSANEITSKNNAQEIETTAKGQYALWQILGVVLGLT